MVYSLGVVALLGIGAAMYYATRGSAVDVDEALARLEQGALTSLVVAGHVSQSDARIWVRHPAQGRLALTLRDDQGERMADLLPTWEEGADHTTSFLLSEAGLSAPSGATVHLDVRDEAGQPVGRCRFHMAPAGPTEEPFAFAIVSCHDPFEENGAMHDDADHFVSGLAGAFDAHGVKRLLLMGDQVYTDLPYALSLFDDAFFARVGPQGRESIFDCSRQEIRQLVQQRYRQFWKVEGWQELQSAFASGCAPDDHEIIDNYGSTTDHDDEAHRRLAQGALDAYHDYQSRRTFAERPACFDHHLSYDRVACFVMDLRSEKVTRERTRVFSDEQLERLRSFLESCTAEVVLIGLSVPFLHVSETMVEFAEALQGDGGDFSDRWNREPSTQSRDELLAVLHAHQQRHPSCRMVVVGGDVHVGAFGQIVWEDGTRPLVQLVTSPVSNEQPPLRQSLAQHSPPQVAKMGKHGSEATARLLEDEGFSGTNPYGGLNAGVVEVRTVDGQAQVRLRLLGLVDDAIDTVALSSWI